MTDPAVTDERVARNDALFLAEASRLLAASLDYETTLATVAALALPHLGSWCFVDLCVPDEPMRRLSVVHPDPDKQALAWRLQSGWPPQRDDPFGVPSVVRTRRSEVVPAVSDDMLRRAARNDENLEILRQLGIGSLMMVPMVARERVLGAITYVSPERPLRFDAHDLELAEDLAARCAMAIDNAMLYRDAGRARAEAEEASRAKTLFLSTMSHELRTPLNAIAGYADLIELGIQGPLTDEQRESLRRIKINQRHLLGLVNSVLDYSKLEAGRLEYEILDVSLDSALSDVDALVMPLAERKGIRYEHDCRDRFLVRADPEKLRQILTNLMTNAVKFTAEQGRIFIGCGRDGEDVLVQVRDTGIGIADEHLEAIFQPFVQVDEGRTRREEGTGLGLAIGRSLSRGMGGDLTVESDPGTGSVFTLRLPAAVAAPVQRDAVVDRT